MVYAAGGESDGGGGITSGPRPRLICNNSCRRGEQRDTRKKVRVLAQTAASNRLPSPVAFTDGSLKRFGVALRDLLLDREEFQTYTGNINWSVFADKLKGTHYETLRKAVSGERQPSIGLMQQVASLLKVDPSYFAEYRLAQAQRQFDVGEVGWETAMKNLEDVGDKLQGT